MRSVWPHEQDEERTFAEKAAEEFRQDPQQYSTGTLEPGSYLGLRWGMGMDGVLVLRLDESFEPVNYMGIARSVRDPSITDDSNLSPVTLADLIPDGCTEFRFKDQAHRYRVAVQHPDGQWEVTGMHGEWQDLNALQFDCAVNVLTVTPLQVSDQYVEERR